MSNSVQSTHAVKQRLALPNLYISPRTLKHVLKTALFVQTHLNPPQVPCFALVWQVFGFCDTQRCPIPIHPPARSYPHRDTITKLKITKVHTCRNIQRQTHRCPDLHPLPRPPNPILINTQLQNTKLQKYACVKIRKNTDKGGLIFTPHPARPIPPPPVTNVSRKSAPGFIFTQPGTGTEQKYLGSLFSGNV